MKKILLALLIISISLLIIVDYKTDGCNILYNKKIWINYTNNFSICVPNGIGEIDEFTGNIEKIKIFSDDIENIGIENDFLVHINNINNEKGDYDNLLNLKGLKDIKKSKFGNKEIIEHYVVNNDGKKEFDKFGFILKTGKDKYTFFGFDKKTSKMKKIINSIKVLEKF